MGSSENRLITLVSSLCGVLSRKKPIPPSTGEHGTTENCDAVIPQANEATTTMSNSMVPPATTTLESEDTTDNGKQQTEEPQQPLPPPPGMGHLRAASYHYQSSSKASKGKLSSSMSMRVQLGGIGSRQSSRRENFDQKREKKLNHEDSIWKKAIILGEKCKVPKEDDTILYDEKGNRISTYHPKITTSISVSRQTSYMDRDAIPSDGEQKKETTKEATNDLRGLARKPMSMGELQREST